MKTEKMETPAHYNNDNGSLYKIAEQRGWNAWQFDAIKRLDRALKKGEFLQDLEKTKVVIDLWIRETDEKRLCENMVKFNKEFDWAKATQETTDTDNLNFMVDCSGDYTYKKMAEVPLCKHMKEPEIKVGTVLIAIDKCKMDNGDGDALKKNKQYTVLAVDKDKNGFSITSELYEIHEFYLSEYSDYFKIK